MERESFEDEEVAKLLNEHYVSIKVDREERPDVDHLYMTVCQALTGHGGWPLTIIMTPDKKPFFAGTYFPKESRRGINGLMDVLEKIAELWVENRSQLLDSSERIVEAVKPRFNQFESGDISEEILDNAYNLLEQNFDLEYGGFYEAPKFPTPHQYMFLLRYSKKTQKQTAVKMVEKSLRAMYNGGIYDHIGLGFARYSTDRKWLVPHFEKMLYDNALLAYTYLEAYQLTKTKDFERIAEEIFTYVLRDMQDDKGGFYSAEDADSEGVEGKFYVWDKSEIINILGNEAGELYCSIYNITEEGNFEGNNIPNLIDQAIDKIAQKNGINLFELFDKLTAYRDTLFNEREKRIHPHKDDKVLTAWNGLMIAALAKGAQVTGKEEYSDAAARAIDFIYDNLFNENGRLLARYRDGESAIPAYLDDYAFLVWGLIEQYEATFYPEYLEKALSLNKQMKDLFWDNENGGYFFYGKDAEQLFARPKEIFDGAMPAGNSVAALNLFRLARLTGDTKLEEDADKQIKAFANSIKQYPASNAFFLNAIWFSLTGTKEVVIVGDKENAETKEMLRFLQKEFLPDTVVVFKPVSKAGDEIAKIVPFIKDQVAIDGKVTAYVCENFACHKPTTDLEALKGLV